MKTTPTWTLSELIPEKGVANEVRKLSLDIEKWVRTMEEPMNEAQITEAIFQNNQLYDDWFHLFELFICLGANGDKSAGQWGTEIQQLRARLKTGEQQLTRQLIRKEALLEKEGLLSFRSVLQERIKNSGANSDFEMAIDHLEPFGLHAWGERYASLTKHLMRKDGQLQVSAQDVYYSGEAQKREEAFQKWREAWGREAEPVAECFNHISGYRLEVQSLRGDTSVMRDSLRQNRISQASIDAMWQAVQEHSAPLITYLKEKQYWIGVNDIHWQDQFAPLPLNDYLETSLPYGEATNIISASLSAFSREMGAFAKEVLPSNWVDAKKKNSSGAFCAHFPKQDQSRIFISFNESLESTGVLAHELGHAYHQRCIMALPALYHTHPPAMAEISSMLSETIVMQTLLQKATSDWEKLHIYNNWLVRDVGTILNGYARYEFEKNAYEARRQGPLSVENLNDIMVEAQKKAYQNSLASYEPTFWASLRHFYRTNDPFVHYPYTVAHLISLGFYRYLLMDENREERLRSLLRDSFTTDVETLVRNYTGKDTTDVEFWVTALNEVNTQAFEFIQLSQKMRRQEK